MVDSLPIFKRNIKSIDLIRKSNLAYSHVVKIKIRVNKNPFNLGGKVPDLLLKENKKSTYNFIQIRAFLICVSSSFNTNFFELRVNIL